MLMRIAQNSMAAPRRILLTALLLMVGFAIYGVPVAHYLSPGGFYDPESESSKAAALLAQKFHRSDTSLIIEITADDGVTSPPAHEMARRIAGLFDGSPYVSDVTSAWPASPHVAAGLVSNDGKSGLIIAGLLGGEDAAPTHAAELATQARYLADLPEVSLRTGGYGLLKAEGTEQTERDLVRTEMIALPVSFLLLVLVFGGLAAAAVPTAVGLLAIAGSMAILRLFALFTDVSIFALNLTVALGLALAVDYTLLIVSRYRDELADGTDTDQALVRTMQTAGRTVVFSAVTVALSMGVMVIFPSYFLKSFAYAGVATVLLAAVAAVVVTPAAIALLGPRLNSLDLRGLVRRLAPLREPVAKAMPEMFWYRSAKFIARRGLPIGLAAVALLVFLGSPFLEVRWGYPDDRVLPTTSVTHQLGDRLRSDYPNNLETAVSVVIPEADGVTSAELGRYAAELSRVPDVTAVSTPIGAYADGVVRGPPVAATGMVDGSVLLTVDTSAPLFSDRSEAQLDRLHAISGPGGRTVQFTGTAMVNRDSIDAITSRLPLALGLIAVIIFALLFVLTGSVVLPVKAVALNLLSLTATFGALVWIFQDGHLNAFGTTPTGTLVANVPVMVFCIAFGLAMDYEVFLIARIQEYWLASTGSRADNDESVALGLARTAKVITVAALLMCVSFGALIAAQVAFTRMFGVGLTLAIIVDVTLVRLVLVPAFMHMAGQWNWWAPKPLVWLHSRIGVNESAPPTGTLIDGHRRPLRAGGGDARVAD